jgi:hypothetical protein
MTREWRERELQALKRSNPQRIVALYRGTTGTDELGQLPAGMGFTSVIDAIVMHEEKTGQFDYESPRAAEAV